MDHLSVISGSMLMGSQRSSIGRFFASAFLIGSAVVGFLLGAGAIVPIVALVSLSGVIVIPWSLRGSARAGSDRAFRGGVLVVYWIVLEGVLAALTEFSGVGSSTGTTFVATETFSLAIVKILIILRWNGRDFLQTAAHEIRFAFAERKLATSLFVFTATLLFSVVVRSVVEHSSEVTLLSEVPAEGSVSSIPQWIRLVSLFSSFLFVHTFIFDNLLCRHPQSWVFFLSTVAILLLEAPASARTSFLLTFTTAAGVATGTNIWLRSVAWMPTLAALSVWLVSVGY